MKLIITLIILKDGLSINFEWQHISSTLIIIIIIISFTFGFFMIILPVLTHDIECYDRLLRFNK